MDSNPYKSPDAKCESVQRGLLFDFDLDSGKLQVDARSALGIIKARFNEELVYKKAVFSKSSNHNISIGDKDYKISLNVINARKGELECSLYSGDGVRLRKYRTAYDFARPDYPAIAFIFVSSICAALIVSYLGLSKWIIFCVLVFIFVLVRIRSIKNISVYRADT